MALALLASTGRAASLPASAQPQRIVSLNLAGLVALVASILYLSQFRAGLIEARVQSLLVQAEIIAVAIAASATVETNTPTIDVDKLLDLKPGESYPIPDEYSDFPINPERVAPVLRRLISPTKTRARIYGGDGGMILDSRSLYGRGDVLRFELPPPSTEKPGFVERATISIRTWLNRGDLPLYRPLPDWVLPSPQEDASQSPADQATQRTLDVQQRIAPAGIRHLRLELLFALERFGVGEHDRQRHRAEQAHEQREALRIVDVARLELVELAQDGRGRGICPGLRRTRTDRANCQHDQCRRRERRCRDGRGESRPPRHHDPAHLRRDAQRADPRQPRRPHRRRPQNDPLSGASRRRRRLSHPEH